MRVRRVAGFVLAVTVVLGFSVVAGPAAAGATSRGVDAWGYNGDGQLGNGHVSRSDPPGAVKGLRDVVAIAAGGYHSLALLRGGTVMSWGLNKKRQLGNDVTGGDVDHPETVNRLSAVSAISAGTFDNLALRSDGTVMAWGQNIYGDLGDGTNADTGVPTAVCAVGATPPCSVAGGTALSGVTAISAGGFHALALLANGTVVAWGENVDGENGDGSTNATGVDVPVPVRGLGSIAAISAGGDHSLALLRDGTVRAWGSDDHGQLGDGRVGRDSVVAVPVKGLANVSAISAGAFHSLALLRDGIVMAWGSDSRGQLGDKEVGKDHDVAREVAGLTGVTAISAGAFDNLALVSDGTVMSWGSNEWGALGFPTAQGTSSAVPVVVPGLGSVSAISAGGYHNLVELS